jgi:hypothetical protein
LKLERKKDNRLRSEEADRTAISLWAKIRTVDPPDPRKNGERRVLHRIRTFLRKDRFKKERLLLQNSRTHV